MTNFSDSAVSALRDVELRNRRGARAGSRGKLAPQMKIVVQPPYGDAPDYIAALVASAANHLEAGYDHLLFSFHGIPERHLQQVRPDRRPLSGRAELLRNRQPGARDVLPRAMFQNRRRLCRAGGRPGGNQCSISFQSRLGRDPWLKPYTDFELVELPKRGFKKLLVICPAFVSDCLETLEEIGIRGANIFVGGRGRSSRKFRV
jgi:ferrochelatase